MVISAFKNNYSEQKTKCFTDGYQPWITTTSIRMLTPLGYSCTHTHA